MHNKPGAKAALVAVKAYNQPPEFHNAAAIQYLLCDLMHLLDDPDLGFSNFSFSEQLKEAYDDYRQAAINTHTEGHGFKHSGCCIISQRE